MLDGCTKHACRQIMVLVHSVSRSLCTMSAQGTSSSTDAVQMRPAANFALASMNDCRYATSMFISRDSKNNVHSIGKQVESCTCSFMPLERIHLRKLGGVMSVNA